jgi:hypothetical protein
MDVAPTEVTLAYTYAWWLTGSEQAARAAVLAAVDGLGGAGASTVGGGQERRLELLLQLVRAAAIAEPTMCPASEIALLHDGIGLGLDAAAGLTAIDARDARTELAHGRLEALPAGVVDIPEPERLGGLAVGNPADIAAARQNPALAALRERIMEGRDELVGVSQVEVPEDLLAQLTGTAPRDLVDDGDDWFAEADLPRSARTPVAGWIDDDGDDPPARDDGAADAGAAATAGGDGTAPAGPDAVGPDAADGDGRGAGTDARQLVEDDEVQSEIDLTTQIHVDSRPTGAIAVARRTDVIWLVLGLAVLLGVVALLLTSGDDVVPGAPDAPPPTLVDPSADAPSDPSGDAPGAPDQDLPDAGPPAADPLVVDPDQIGPAFAVTDAGVAVGIGADPGPEDPEVSPLEPISFTVEYVGAEELSSLLVDWTVDDAPFATEAVDLTPLFPQAKFSRQVPDDGWPVGQHVLVMTYEPTGEVVAEVTFTVVDGGE